MNIHDIVIQTSLAHPRMTLELLWRLSGGVNTLNGYLHDVWREANSRTYGLWEYRGTFYVIGCPEYEASSIESVNEAGRNYRRRSGMWGVWDQHTMEDTERRWPRTLEELRRRGDL